MRHSGKIIYRLLISGVLLMALLSGCGEGGGGGGSSEGGSAPSAPTGVTATAGNGQVTISWSAVSDATLYNIYWSTTSGVTKTTGTKLTGAASPYTHSGLTNGTTYYYVVTATNSYGESNESSEVSETLIAPAPPAVTKQQDIVISLPQGSSLNNETLKVVSFYGTVQSPPKAQRLYKTIPITVTDTNKGQIIIVVDSQDNPLFFSYFEATTGTATIASEDIAKGLIWMNPYVMILPKEQKKQFMDKAITSILFPQLKTKIENLLVTDPKNLLNPDTHPEIIKTAFAIVKETFEALGTQQLKTFKNIGASGDLRVLDKAGNNVSFENPKMTAYGIEWIDSSGSKTYVLVKGKEGIATFQWGWPPVTVTPPIESDVISSNDGIYKAIFYKGFNTDVSNWWLPYIPGSPVQFSPDATIVGTATWYNTFTAMDIFIETVTGNTISDHIINLIGRIVKEAGNIKGFYDLAKAIQGGDAVATFGAIVDLLNDKDNWKIISKVIWDQFGPDSVAFMKQAKTLIKNIVAVLKTVDWVNYNIPFMYDLGFAPWKVEYCISQTGEVISECSGAVTLIPPVATLSVSSINLYVGDTVTFDASKSTDDRTITLQYRFDFNGDGNWDTSWSYTSTKTYTYLVKGTYNAKVEVMDGDGLTAIANYYIMVYERGKGISTAIVIDRSGSMYGTDIENAKTAAKSYVGYMGTDDRAALISFSSSVTVDQPFTSDKTLLTAAIDNLVASGMTAFYDAVYEAVTETTKEDSIRRRAIIALTDGVDNSSFYKQETDISIYKSSDVSSYAKQKGIPVYTIGLDVTSTTEAYLYNLAIQTNGLYFNAPNSTQIKSIYDAIVGIQ